MKIAHNRHKKILRTFRSIMKNRIEDANCQQDWSLKNTQRNVKKKTR